MTGGAGFIGATLVRTLKQHPAVDAITVVDDLSTGSMSNLEGVDGIRMLQGSVLDAALLGSAFADCDSVIHLAARPSVPRSVRDPVASHEANATGTVRVLEAARKAGNAHVIVASSSSVYGANPALPKHEDLAAAPLSPYAASKLAAEGYASAYASSFGTPVLVFRFFNVFGPLQPAGHAYAAAIPAFLSAALAGDPIPIHGDGLQSRDFTYVGTVANVLADAALRRMTSDGPVNLAFGSRRTLLDVVATLESILERPLAVEHLPPRPGDVAHSQADATRLRELFPDVVPVDFSEGLAHTAEWFRRAAGPRQ